MTTGFEMDQYRAQVALVQAINRLSKAIEESNKKKGEIKNEMQ